jgi:DNA-binding response OmpR family regulator
MGNKVLVVDDESNICELVSIALKNKGMDIRTAEAGESGIMTFNEFKPDVVLLDHRLPDMSGNDVARKMKAVEAGKKTRIIMMSGEDKNSMELDTSLYAGWLKKPFKLSYMVEYVEKCLEK